MVNVIASIHIKEGHLPEFMEIFKSNVPKVLEEEGCIEYVPTIDLPATFEIDSINMVVKGVCANCRL